MNRDDADRAIASLSAAYDRAAAAMYAIDSATALGFLRSGGLTGRTAEIWAALSPEIDARWTEFSALGEALEQARSIRATRRSSDPQWSTLERSLGWDLPRLAAAMESGTTAVSAILADVDLAWTAASAAISPVTAAMTALSRCASEVGDTDGIAPLAQRVALISDQVLTDPLTSAARGMLHLRIGRELGNLSADIRAADTRIADQARMRDAFPDRRAALTARIDAVEEAEQGVRAAFARATEKIADPGLPPEAHTCDVLRARLSMLDARHEQRQWRRLADDAAMMDATIAHALTRAAELTDAANGLVARRDELRGRLDAYRAKAASHRLDEHDALAPLHTQAHALLYTAPCDLPASTKAVHAYQKALTVLTQPRSNSEDVSR